MNISYDMNQLESIEFEEFLRKTIVDYVINNFYPRTTDMGLWPKSKLLEYCEDHKIFVSIVDEPPFTIFETAKKGVRVGTETHWYN